jgi:hypothetical protein
VDSLVPLAVDVGGLLLKKGHHTGYVLDPFQEEEDVPVPFQAVVVGHPTVHVVEDKKWVELVAVQGVELRTAEAVDTVAVQTGLEGKSPTSAKLLTRRYWWGSATYVWWSSNHARNLWWCRLIAMVWMVDFADSAPMLSCTPASILTQWQRKEWVGLVAGIDSVAGVAG